MSATARKSRLGDGYVGKREIRIVKSCDTIPNRKDAIDKLLSDMESELGRLSKLLQQTRAEFLRASD